MTMELRAVVMFYSALLGATLPAKFNLFQSVSSRTNTDYWYSVCSSQHGLKQIKLCFNSRAGCEAALCSDGRLCLQSYLDYLKKNNQQKYKCIRLFIYSQSTLLLKFADHEPNTVSL